MSHWYPTCMHIVEMIVTLCSCVHTYVCTRAYLPRVLTVGGIGLVTFCFYETVIPFCSHARMFRNGTE